MAEPTKVPTTEDVKDAIAAVHPDAGKWPGEYKLADGTTIKANSYEEAFQIAVDMKVNTAQALRDREEQVRQARQELEELQRARPGVPLPTNNENFDEKTYWELANKDPRLATRYALAADLGVEPDVLPQLFNEMRNVSVYSADNMEIQRFMQSNPDFPGTDEAAGLLVDRLVEQNLPLTARNLEYEYLRGVRNGEIEPLGEEAERPFVPPNIGSGASLSREDVNILQQLRDVPDDKLDDAYRKLGLLK